MIMETLLFAITLLLMPPSQEMVSECERTCLEGRSINERRCHTYPDPEDRAFCLRAARVGYEDCVARCSVGSPMWETVMQVNACTLDSRSW
jgi:hypothetical protein